MAVQKGREKSSMYDDASDDYDDDLLTIISANQKLLPSSPGHDRTNVTHGNNNDVTRDACASPTPSHTKLVMFFMVCFTIVMIFSINANFLRAYLTKNTMDTNWYLLKEAPCSQPKEKLREMSSLAVDASSALRLLGSSPFACYGTLLGALRRGSVLPWDNNIDLCLVNRIDKDFETIREVFSSLGIEIRPYDDWDGRFYVRRNGADGYVTVFSHCTFLDNLVFGSESDTVQVESSKEIDTDTTSQEAVDSSFRLCPDGTLPYINQILQGHAKPIPSVLLRAPFSSLPFGKNTSITIPHGDVEILKYFYPDSWWLEIKPVGC